MNYCKLIRIRSNNHCLPRFQISIKNNLEKFPLLACLTLFANYMTLFDVNFTKSVSTKCFKALTLKNVNNIESKLNKWKNQSYHKPVSPKLFISF